MSVHGGSSKQASSGQQVPSTSIHVTDEVVAFFVFRALPSVPLRCLAVVPVQLRVRHA